MSLFTRDIALEAADLRPLIESWLVRYGNLLGFAFLAVSALLLVAALRTATMRIDVLAITPEGEPYPIPAYDDAPTAQRAAAELSPAGAAPSQNRTQR